MDEIPNLDEQVSDAMLAALTALVNHDISRRAMELTRYGEWMSEPDQDAIDALRAAVAAREATR